MKADGHPGEARIADQACLTDLPGDTVRTDGGQVEVLWPAIRRCNATESTSRRPGSAIVGRPFSRPGSTTSASRT